MSELNISGIEAMDHYCLNLAIFKNQEYGMGNLMRYGEMGIWIRITDKFERIANKYENGKIPNTSDKFNDNILDMINYLKYLLLIREGALDSKSPLLVRKFYNMAAPFEGLVKAVESGD